MTTVTDQIPTTGGFTEDAFHRFLKGRDEPAWLVERRREAFARFQAFPWPGAREEEWRRTDIRALKLDAFAPPAAGEPTAEAIAAFDDLWRRLELALRHRHAARQRRRRPASPTRRSWAARSSSTWRRRPRTTPRSSIATC